MRNFLQEINGMGAYTDSPKTEWEELIGESQTRNRISKSKIQISDLPNLVVVKDTMRLENPKGHETRFYNHLAKKYDCHRTTAAHQFKRAMELSEK